MFFAMALALTALTSPTTTSAAPAIDMMWAVKIPMRDGVKLNATLFVPRGAPGPVVFTMTPYVGDSYQERASYFASHGFAFALVDVRGRGNSGGAWEPFFHEGKDGADVVEWLAKQPFCNGKVAMWGGSYAGFDQWMTARERPKHLVTIAPAAAAYVGVEFPMVKNIFGGYGIRWLTLTSGATDNSNLFSDGAYWRAKLREAFVEHRPFRALDDVSGNKSTVFQTWLAHPTHDAYWQRLSVTAADYRAMTALPVLTITGQYDAEQTGALGYYKEAVAAGAAENHYVVIGPWNHGGTRTPKASFDGLTFGAASLVDMNELHRQWYAWTMGGGARPAFLKGRVAYYVVGPEEWRYADSVAAITTSSRTLYLSGSAHGVFHSGELATTSATGADGWTYDPLDTRTAEIEDAEVADEDTDQRGELALDDGGAGVVYHSAPFAEDTLVAGAPRVELWLEADVKDFDVMATLYEVKLDGSAVLLGQDMMRLRHREGTESERLLEPGAVAHVTLADFHFIARRIDEHARLRLAVSSPNTMFLEKNYGSGGAVASESAKDAHTAHVTLLHDAAHPSALVLPLGSP